MSARWGWRVAGALLSGGLAGLIFAQLTRPLGEAEAQLWCTPGERHSPHPSHQTALQPPTRILKLVSRELGEEGPQAPLESPTPLEMLWERRRAERSSGGEDEELLLFISGVPRPQLAAQRLQRAAPRGLHCVVALPEPSAHRWSSESSSPSGTLLLSGLPLMSARGWRLTTTPGAPWARGALLQRALLEVDLTVAGHLLRVIHGRLDTESAPVSDTARRQRRTLDRRLSRARQEGFTAIAIGKLGPPPPASLQLDPERLRALSGRDDLALFHARSFVWPPPGAAADRAIIVPRPLSASLSDLSRSSDSSILMGRLTLPLERGEPSVDRAPRPAASSAREPL